MRKSWMKAFVGMMAVVSLVAQAPVQVFATGGNGAVLQGKLVATGSTTQSSTDEWAGVTEAAGEENFELGKTDEFGCHLKSWHTCYKYEYAYRTGDTSGLSNEEEMAFYEGLKGYLDYAYQFDTPYEQEKAIHDYMVLNCRYAVGHYIDGKLSNDVWNYDGVFVHGQAVCQGYALAFKLCMDILGIESQIILGTTPEGKHAWNAVKLDDGWYWVDVTWDDPVPDVEGQVRYHYFNVPRWVMDIEHTTATTFDVEGTKYFGDEVLTLTVGEEQPELNRMLARHFWDLSQHTVLRVYLVKEDGSAWTQEEVQAYQVPLSRMNGSVYNIYRSYDVENGSALCYYFQGWGTTGEVLLEYLISIVVFAGAIAVIVVVVRKLRKRRKRRLQEMQDVAEQTNKQEEE